ncbi:MAG: hypothetical protein WD063_06495 [Pirellulales bacterium]
MADYNQEFVASSARTGLFVPLLTMVALFVVGAAIIIRRGLRVGFTADGEAERDLPPQPAARGWPRGRLALALGVAVVLNLMTLANLDAAARQSISALRSDAYALAMSVAPQPVPDEENAATYYLQAFQALDRMYKNLDRPENRWYKAWSDASDSDKEEEVDYGTAEATAFVEAHQGEINLLRTGATLPHYYYDRNYGQTDVTTLLPDIQGMRGGARLLAIHARWSDIRGDTKSALADVTAMAGLARHAGEDVFAVTILVGAAIDRIAFDTLQTILRSRNPSAEELAAARVNHLFSYQRQMNRILRGEEATILNTMAEIDSALAWSTPKWLGGTNSGAVSVFGLGPCYRAFVLLPMMARFRREMEHLYTCTSLPYSEFETQRLELESNWQGGLASIAPTTSATIETTYRADACNLVAYTALAMHRYRAEHGRFPDTLEELTPEIIPIVPGDPYVEQTLRLEKTDRGWVVYSVGPDTTDDHGTPASAEQKHHVLFKGDIGFEYAEEEKAEE